MTPEEAFQVLEKSAKAEKDSPDAEAIVALGREFHRLLSRLVAAMEKR